MITWQTGSITLQSIRSIFVNQNYKGKKKNTIFKSGSMEQDNHLNVTIDSEERPLHLQFSDLKSRNFWLQAIVLHLSFLQEENQRKYPKSFSELKECLEVTNDVTEVKEIHFINNGNFKMSFLAKSISQITPPRNMVNSNSKLETNVEIEKEHYSSQTTSIIENEYQNNENSDDLDLGKKRKVAAVTMIENVSMFLCFVVLCGYP